MSLLIKIDTIGTESELNIKSKDSSIIEHIATLNQLLNATQNIYAKICAAEYGVDILDPKNTSTEEG